MFTEFSMNFYEFQLLNLESFILSKQMMYNVNLVDVILFAVIIVGHLQCRITRNGILG